MSAEKLPTTAVAAAVAAMLFLSAASVLASGDTNHVYQPCADAKVQRSDGFTFGLAFSRLESFFFNRTQLSPCDRRLPAASDSNSRVAVFRPKVDEISLLSVNSSFAQFANTGGYMVAFAGRKYAARSVPIFVSDGSHILTGFTLVLEFSKGTLQNLYWKRDHCKSCQGPNFECLSNVDCAVKKASCKENNGKIDCGSLNIQVTFSGTDKHLAVLNSWYEVSELQQYSLVGLYSGLKSSLGI